MSNMLIKSQDGKMVIYPELISVGRRQPVTVIGDKLKELMDKKGMTEEDLIKRVGNSYRENVTRTLNNTEIPKPKLVEKIASVLEVENDYFEDKELENVICVQGGIIIGKYDTNLRAEEVRKEMTDILERCHANNEKIVFTMPEK